MDFYDCFFLHPIPGFVLTWCQAHSRFKVEGPRVSALKIGCGKRMHVQVPLHGMQGLWELQMQDQCMAGE
jgi:hypothetical protein